MNSKNGVEGLRSKLIDFLKVQNLKDGFNAVLKKREGSQGLFIILLILAFELEMLCQQSRENYFLYLRKVLKFQMWDFTRLMTIAGCIGLTGQYIFVPLFSKYLKVHDTVISLIGKYR